MITHLCLVGWYLLVAGSPAEVSALSVFRSLRRLMK